MLAVIIKRMQVESGFLDGLDLHLDHGLNVLIGGRGTGKSSVIELIRYCLDAKGNGSEEDAKRSREQALSVLQDGQVTLTIGDDFNDDFDVSRTAGSDPEGLNPGLTRPLIFSQKDVESVGLSIRGRLNIVDFFSVESATQKADERKHITQIKSLTTEIAGLLREADQISERLAGAESVQEELKRAEARSAEMSRTSQQLDQKQKQLELLSAQSATLAVKADALGRALQTTTSHRDTLTDALLFGFALDDWPPTGGDDLLKLVRERLAKVEMQVSGAIDLIGACLADIEAAIKRVEKERTPIEEQARTIRREIERLKEGAGAVARQLAGLREQSSQLRALETLREQKLERAARIQTQRGKLLDQLDALREARSSERQRVARILNRNLSPLIRIKIRQSAQLGEFIGAISNAVRGSGLRYNELANLISATMTPRELVEAAENLDRTFLSRTAGISLERAERIANQLRASGCESIVSVPLDDIADFELLDGADFKPMGELSVGQRCTVVLSILLQHPDRVLIVDQPEDHLDNAFIVETLIGAIRKRAGHSQILFSTHNANIPVLGEAARVIRLASNGHRGFVVSAEPLDHPNSVEAITTVMEGGHEAFVTRAKFYSRYSNE